MRMERLSSFFMQFHMQTLSSRFHHIAGSVSLFVISYFIFCKCVALVRQERFAADAEMGDRAFSSLPQRSARIGIGIDAEVVR